jgi:transcriptional regulator with XRE-family HTH domain
MKMEDILRTVGREIASKRLAKGLRQQQLGTLVQGSQVYISQCERGEVNLSLTNLDLLAASLGCRVEIKLRKIQNATRKAKSS